MEKLSKKQYKKLIANIIIPIVLCLGILLLECIFKTGNGTNAVSYGFIWDEKTNNWVEPFYVWLLPWIISGIDVFNKFFDGIKNLNFMDENFLMVVATLGALYCGEYSEAVAVMIFYNIGEFFQDFAVGKSRNSVKELMSIAPDYANREKSDGTVELIDPDDIWVDDILIVKPGEKIPVDGVVIEGEGLINTSALTGESLPESVGVGDDIFSGCVNGDTLLKIKATKLYDDSTVSKILELVETASTKKSKTEKFITKFARIYTPIVVGAAVLLAIIPSLIFGGWKIWLLRACTFLVISCPCALVISVPLAFFGGIGAASKIGVLIKGANYLEMMSTLDTLVTDKTGTLTFGEFEITKIRSFGEFTEDEVVKFAAAIEKNSSHPIAKKIVETCSNPITESLISEVTNIPGRGMKGDVGFFTILVGNAEFLIDNGIDIPNDFFSNKDSIVYVAKSKEFVGSIELKDKVKIEAKDSIANIMNEGVKRVVMLTGDTEEAATTVAGELGITEYRARLLPQGKVSAVEELLDELTGSKRYLAYIGDGINDAPVLARADIGIAMGSLGSDAAIEASDIVIMDDKLDKIASLIRIARKTLSISKINIIFALFVKFTCLILGALGIANMWIAVFADVGVAMICILNSMRMLINNKEIYNVKSK